MSNSVQIQSQNCIGCTKCLEVCPTDAIFGAQGLLHEVILEDCIGCERCIPICPVDCIELIPMPHQYDPHILDDAAKNARIHYIRELAQSHKTRISLQEASSREAFELAKKSERTARQDYLNSLFNKKIP